MANADLLGTLARVVSTNPSQESLCRALFELCERSTGAAGFAVLLAEDDEPLVLFTRGETLDVHLAMSAIGSATRAVQRAGDRETVAFPLVADGRPFGAVVLGADGPIAGDDLDFIETAVLFASGPIANRRLADSMERDPLTGLANRRAFDRTLRGAWRRGLRSRKPITLILSDVDLFNAYNARYGHLAGDICLQRLAQVLSAHAAAASGLVARLGEDEFAVLLPGYTEDDAISIVDDIHETLAGLDLPHRGSSLGRVTTSTAIASSIPEGHDDPGRLVAIAKDRLAHAKGSGRNRRVGSIRAATQDPPAFERFEAQTNFPHPHSSFVGREREMKELVELLSANRLATIVGTGGSGKTRIALEVGRRLAEAHRDGARWVDLAPMRHASEIVSVLARAFAVPEVSAVDALDMLLRDLREFDALVVLDNCEHVQRDCANIVPRLIAECPRLQVLATSREPLQLAGETVYRLRGLTASDSLMLFSERASLHDSRQDAGSERAVKAIVKHLDGNPLAIELVAAHLAEFGLRGLLSALERHGGLGFAARAKPQRHESLYQTIDWSFTLLEAPQQTLLTRLSIFAFGGRVEALREICADGALHKADIDDALRALDRKSLIELAPGQDEFRIAVPTAHYGQRRLQTAEFNALALRFGHWYARRSCALHPENGDAEYQALLTADPIEIENYLSALRRLLPERRDLQAGALLCANLCAFLGRVGRYADARRWLTSALEHADLLEDALVAKLHHTMGVTAYGQADAKAAEDHAREALALYERVGDELGIARSLQTIGSSYYIRGGYSQAREIYKRCLDVYRALGSEQATISALANLAAVEYDGYCNTDSALVYIRSAIVEARRLHSEYKLGASLLTLGQVLGSRDDFCGAFEAFDESAQILERLGHPILALTLSGSARLYLRLNQPQKAQAALRRALHIYVGAEAPHYVAYCIESFALLASAMSRHDAAAYLLGFSDAYRQRNADLRANVEQPDYDGVVRRARHALGDGIYRQAYERGTSASLAVALREAILL